MKINFEGGKLEKQNVESLIKPHFARYQALDYEIKELGGQLKKLRGQLKEIKKGCKELVEQLIERRKVCSEILNYLIPSILKKNDITELKVNLDSLIFQYGKVNEE